MPPAHEDVFGYGEVSGNVQGEVLGIIFNEIVKLFENYIFFNRREGIDIVFYVQIKSL